MYHGSPYAVVTGYDAVLYVMTDTQRNVTRITALWVGRSL